MKVTRPIGKEKDMFKPDSEELFAGLLMLIITLASVMFIINRVFIADMSYDTDSINIMSYFTIETNIISTAWMLSLSAYTLTGRKMFKVSTDVSLAASITTYILVTGIVYWTVLVPIFYKPGETWLFSISNIWMHSFVPLSSLIMFYYVRQKNKAESPQRRLWFFFIYPILYIALSIVYAINGKYLYPMFNPNAVGGWAGVAVCLTIMCAIFTLLYLALLYGIKRKANTENTELGGSYDSSNKNQ